VIIICYHCVSDTECSVVEANHEGSYMTNLEVCSTCSTKGPADRQLATPTVEIRRRCSVYSSNSVDRQAMFPSQASVLTHEQDRLSIADGKLSRNISLESRLLRYFSKVVEPDQVMEWIVKRSKLNQLIYLQTNKYLKSVYKLELDAGLGHYNPKAAVCIHPYGCEEDANKFVTLEVRIKTTSRSKCLKMHSNSRVVVKACAEDEDGNLIGTVRKVEDSARLSYFYIKRFIRHVDLKVCHSRVIHFMFSCSYIDGNSVCGVHGNSSSWCIS